MSTRKTKINADSPTPNSGNESAPNTPKGRKRLIRNKIEKPDDKDEAVKKNEKLENSKVDTKKDEKQVKVDKETPAKKRGFAKNLSKDDLALIVKASDRDKVRDARPKRKSASAISLAKAAQKKKILTPKTDPVKRGRKRRNSTGRIDEVQRKQSERLRKEGTMRKGRSKVLLKSPDKLIKVARKRLILSDKTDAKLPKRIKKEKLEPSSDSELLTASRRRSDSISKCSDMTDISSLMDVPLNMLRDTEESLNSNESPDIVDEKPVDSGDGVVVDNKVEVKDVKPKDVEQLVSPVLNDSGIGSDLSQLNKVEFIEPRAVTPVVKDDFKDSHIEVFNCDLESAKCLTLNTPDELSVCKDDSEKASSLSPVLESEGISEISVKQFYGQPDFLENNLGIEEDPKLGEIVQVHEKHKLDAAEIVQESKDDGKIDIEAVSEQEPTTKDESNSEEQLVTKEELNQKNEIEVDVESNEDLKEDKPETEITTNGVHEAVPKEEVEEDIKELPKPNCVIKIDKSIDEDVEMTEDKPKVEEDVHTLSLNSKQSIPKAEPIIEPENKENILNNFKDPADDKKNFVPIKDDKSDAPLIIESPERLKQKESHLLKLGLLTHKAAVAAKIEKQKRREQLHSNSKSSKSQRGSDYTGTLKTVIKLHRPIGGDKNEKKKSRLPLKMTLHKGRGKSVNDKETTSANNSEDDTYYTIQNEQPENSNVDKTDGAQSRKTHNRNHTSEASVTAEPVDGTKETEKALVIPEKASSFRIHPDKLCQDQCFYCGGRFGLFDTPCHVAQIKSLERQKKILDNEEKLTVDNCLCDACFRHVDRRANCPSYKKRLSATTSSMDYNNFNDSIEDSSQISETHASHKSQLCNVTDCEEAGNHTVRRKWFMKMKKSISKLLNFNLDGHAVGTLSICDKHYDVISHLMVCALCKRRLMRNHIYYVSQEVSRLEELLKEEGIPVSIGTSPVVCKLCRYYSNLLLKPPEGKSQKAMFAKNYRKRLLQFHDLEVADDDVDNKAQSTEQSTSQKQQTQNQSTAGKRGRPPKRPRPSQESASSPPSTISDSGDKSSNHSANAGQMILDNDVMVDYAPPAMFSMASIMQNQMKSKGVSMTIEPKQQSTTSSKEDISLLRGNPNISMRELFPGEEEMALNVNIPFNSGGQRTPEGWTKVMTTIQYDEQTRHLWEELQKPYGNQSSFIRHLILLEKYYRNGDLVLTPGATYNAVNYSESVQQRLQSFDSRCTSNYSLNNLYKMTNSPISIFPTTKAKPKPTATETTSLLKFSVEQERQVAQLAKQRKVQLQQQLQQQQLAKAQAAKREQLLANSLRPSKSDDATKNTKQIHGIPPELICINTTKSPSTSSSASNTSNSQPSTPQTQQQAQTSKQSKQGDSNSLLIPSASSSSAQKKSANQPKSSSQPNITRLPDILSPAERLECNKWRPTLIPVSAGPPALDGQLYQTADGRKLPNLVQVQSGGKPYLISIHDYNRMCIMRRERLLRDQMIQRQQQAQQSIATQQQAMANHQSLLQKMQQQSSAQLNTNQQLQQQQQQTSLQPTSQSAAKTTTTIVTNSDEISSNNNKLSMSITQIPNKILEQNSVIPLNSKSSTLDSLLKVRKANSASLLKPNLQSNTMTKPTHTITTINQQNIVSITSTPSISAILGVPPISIVNTPPIPSTSKSPPSALDALMKTTQQATQSNMWSWAESLNNGNGGVVIDNSAASLLSKIPKSLTVIPQQKSRLSKSSSED